MQLTTKANFRWGTFSRFVAIAGIAAAALPTAAVAADRSASYFVSCRGNDSNSGTSPSSPWKSLRKANASRLTAGDGLYLERGCEWNEPFIAAWHGTAMNPIIVGAYGKGDLPLLRLDAHGTMKVVKAVTLAGEFEIVQDIRTTLVNPNLDPRCVQRDGKPVPFGWYIGFSVSGANNILRRVSASQFAVGAVLTASSQDNTISDSTFTELSALWRLDPKNGSMGAIGILIGGNGNEIARTFFARNSAECLLGNGDVQSYSAPFELYNANRTIVHHNRAFGHRKQIEMGHDPGKTSDDNVIAFNLFVSSNRRAVGPNIHGSGDRYGPVRRTQILHNTIVFTGEQSVAIVCACDGGAKVEDNIFVAGWKAGFYSGEVNEDHNLYWTAEGRPAMVQFKGGHTRPILGSGSMTKNPMFVRGNAEPYDFRVESSSPAVDGGNEIATSNPILSRVLASDLDDQPVPQGLAADIGAFEHHAGR